MKNKLSTFFGFLFLAAIICNSIACNTANNIGLAQTNNTNRNLSNSPANSANTYNGNSNTLDENSNLAIQNEAEEKLCDVELAESPKQVSPSYNLKVSTTGEITLDNTTRKSFNRWFSIFSGAWLEPFSEGKAKDEQLISFANTALFGFSEELRKETARCKNDRTGYDTNTGVCTPRVDEKEIERVVDKYFQLPIRKHGFSEEPARYKAGCYYCGDACCSDGEMTFYFTVVERIIALKDGNYLADVKNYKGLSSDYAECNSDCERKRLQEIKNAATVSDFETITKLCPQWEAKPVEKMRAKIKIVKSGKEVRPILVSYEKIEAYTMN